MTQVPHGLREESRNGLRRLLERSADGPLLLLTHDDADGLASAVLLHRALAARGRVARIRTVGRFQQAWGPSIGDEVRTIAPAAVIATDLGVPAHAPFTGVPTLILDHHVPLGAPSAPATTVVSGYGSEPQPCSSVLAWYAAAEVTDPGPLAWLAALGVIGDFGEAGLAAFPDLQAAALVGNSRTALRAATTLINAARRSTTGNADAALALLRKANSARDLTAGAHTETQALEAARDEVTAELQQARRVAPVFAGPVALLRVHSRCQVHPLVAQAWVGRLRGSIIVAANSGYRDGFVHFAARTGSGEPLVDFLRAKCPPLAADESCAGGHQQASGGALRADSWVRFARDLGFPGETIAPPFPRRP